MRRKIILSGSIFVWVLYLILSIFVRDVYAAEKRLVKVAFFPMDGYHIMNADGSFGGMDVEYLNALCEYTDWKIEYVQCDSWEEALKLLSEKQVDLVGSAQYSEERAKEYQYADLASGYTFGVIAANPDSTIAYEDFTAMQNVSFGMVENYVRKNELLEYLHDYGIDNPTIEEYASTSELQNALVEGKIDALVHTFTEVKEGQRLIGRFAPKPFYYITYKGNDDVIRELNQATADLKMNCPELETELMNKFYYNRFDKTALLTTDENEYIKSKAQVKVGYLDGFYPFSYEEDGEFKGLTKELLENVIRDTGLETVYCKMSDRQNAHKALQSGEVDVLAYCTDTQETLNEYNQTKACNYANSPLVLVMDKDKNIDEIEKMATVSFLMEKVGTAIQADKIQVVTKDRQQDCIDALRKKEVDAVFCDGYLAEYLLRTEVSYENLTIKNVYSSEYEICMVTNEKDAILQGILKKTIPTIDSKKINVYMLKENTYPLVSIINFVKKYSLWIISGLLLCIILVILVALQMIRNGKKIQKLMYRDTKIDIWNLNYLIYWGEYKLLPEHKSQYAVVYLNLEQFRRYNIIYGWNAGETLLKSVADILIKHVNSKTEICARDQGDRFAMLLKYSDKESFIERIKAIRNDVEKWILSETGNHMSLKMGVYYVSEGDNDLRLAISNANQALEFNAKDNEIKIFDSGLKKMLKERHEREQLLDSVDINKDFTVYYQPKIDIRNGKIVGAEALVRFLDPSDGGVVKAPGFFVPYYEQNGRITEIDFFVFESVCKMLRRRIDAGLPVVTVSCNFSRTNFIKPGFPEHFVEILERYQIPKELIEVEITETLIVEELHQYMVKKTLDMLKEKGIRLSIDDFGAGYSSLGVFEQIPASVIKLDRSFLLNQEDHERQVKIMRGIVKLGEELEAQIVCEGVETQTDVNLMKEIGANVAQGYFYSKPVPENIFEEKLTTTA